MLINRWSLLVLLLALLALVSAPIYERVSWRGTVPEQYRAAKELVADVPATGALDPASDAPLYVLRTRAGRLYTVDLTAENFDPKLTVDLVSGDTVSLEGADDDGGDDTDARYAFCAAADAALYVITVGAVSDGGDYQLRVAEEESEVCREGQAFVARLPLEFRKMPRVARPGSPASARMNGTPDHWVLDAAAEHLYTVTVTSSEIDPALAVHAIENVSARTEGEDDDGGEGNNARLVFCSRSEPGLYVLAVRAVGASEGSYVLAVEDGGAEACRGGAAARAMLPVENASIAEIRPGSTESAVLGDGETRRYFLATRPGREYELRLNASGFDAFLRVYRALGGELTEAASDDDGGGDLNSMLTFCATAGGAWVAEVSSVGNSGRGSYQLRMTEGRSC